MNSLLYNLFYFVNEFPYTSIDSNSTFTVHHLYFGDKNFRTKPHRHEFHTSMDIE